MKIFIVFGDQLFPLDYYSKFSNCHFLMIESRDLCTHYKYHKNRLIFFMAAMRHKRDEFRLANFKITHLELNQFDSNISYQQRLLDFCLKNKVTEIHCFEKEDKFFKTNLNTFSQANGIKINFYQSPLFLNSHREFKDYLSRYKKPFMKHFYEDSRKRFKLLVDKNNKPVGGKWSFDEDNRSKLKAGVVVPKMPQLTNDPITTEVIQIIESNFSDHPGENLTLQPNSFFFPVKRADALLWLQEFLKIRLQNFGLYEDAISSQHDFIFHSLLSPLMNVGLLTPKEVINTTLAYAQKNQPPLNSLEGFIRQIVGWREFVRGIYHNFSEVQEERNFFKHQRKLKPCWYDGNTGIEPLDNSIKKIIKYSYAHHIERLMIISNLMLLCEVDPKEVHRWFNEMFIDSMDYGTQCLRDGAI